MSQYIIQGLLCHLLGQTQNTENANFCAGQPRGRSPCLLSRAPELWNLSAQTTMTQPRSWTTLLFASLQRQNLAFQDVKRKRVEEFSFSPEVLIKLHTGQEETEGLFARNQKPPPWCLS